MFCDAIFIATLFALRYTDDQNEPMYQNDTNILNNYSHCYVILMAGSKWAKLYIIPSSNSTSNLEAIIKVKPPHVYICEEAFSLILMLL